MDISIYYMLISFVEMPKSNDFNSIYNKFKEYIIFYVHIGYKINIFNIIIFLKALYFFKNKSILFYKIAS